MMKFKLKLRKFCTLIFIFSEGLICFVLPAGQDRILHHTESEYVFICIEYDHHKYSYILNVKVLLFVTYVCLYVYMFCPRRPQGRLAF